MSDFDDLKAELKRARDEIALRLHLASMDAKWEWQELEGKWNDFAARAEVDETTEGVGVALKNLGTELKLAYDRLKNALRD